MSEKPVSKWADLGVRSTSALVLVPVVLFLVWWGGFLFTGFLACLGILMAREWVNICFGKDKRQLLIHQIAGVAFIVGSPIAVIGFLLVLMMISWFLLAKDGGSIWHRVGVLYVGLPILALDLLRSDAHFGLYAVVWCMVIVWSADVMAYFFGRIIGGPKLAPRISPKKTWAGMVGAVVGAALASILFSHYASMSILPLAAFAAVLAVAEQGGDIIESTLKRHYGVKDSSNLIPGHGGALDRIDGLIAVVSIAAIIGWVHNPASVAAGLLSW